MCPAGGAPFPVELMERWRRATGHEIYEGYGMSEMAPISATTTASGVEARRKMNDERAKLRTQRVAGRGPQRELRICDLVALPSINAGRTVG